MAVMSNIIIPPCCNITSDKNVKLYCHLGCCDPKEWWYKELHEDTCRRLKSFSSALLTTKENSDGDLPTSSNQE